MIRFFYIAMISGLVLIPGIPARAQWMPRAPGPDRFPAAWRYAVYIHPSLLSDFNRVDGLVHSLHVLGRLPTDFDRPPLFALDSRIDLHTVSLPHYRVRGGAVGGAMQLPDSRFGDRSGWRASLRADYHKQTVSPDDWIVGRTENMLAALLTKNDYKNYHQAEGYQIALAVRYVPRFSTVAFTFQAGWHDNLHRPLTTATRWSLLPWSGEYRPNYTAAPGRERLVRLALTAEISDTPRQPRRQAKIMVTAEKAGRELGGDFDFNGLFGSAATRLATTGSQWMTLRVAGGARSGSLFDQHLLRFGGLGTLRGTPQHAFAGNRIWFFTAEYHLSGVLLNHATFFPFSLGLMRKARPLIDMGCFYDVGAAYRVSPDSRILSGWFEGKARDNWGVFLSIAGDLLRVEWASTRYLGREHADILRLRTGWQL